jgi:hypothetical protein
VQAVNVDDVAPVEVAPGILRRSLTTTDQARAWLIDFGPGTQWPGVDVHDGEERYFVIDGEIIDGDAVFGPGSYVVLAKGSSHQPRSESGGRMLGINIIEK